MKKMKKHDIKISLLLLVVLLFVGCNDSFLERYPLDEISSETFWNTENDLKAYNNGLYELATYDDNVPIMMGCGSGTAGYKYGTWWLDCFSDNVVIQGSRLADFAKVRAGIHSIPSSPVNFGYRGWNFVRACNVGLENYDRAEIAETVKNLYKAEAHLFRGWFYGDKVSKFADVQWIGQSLNIDSEELYGERTPREEVMANVLEDLDFACQYLPDDWGDGNAPGRLNRWCALQVKSRVCLFEGTWRKYHGGTNPDFWLQQAAEAAKELIENGPYHLYSTGDVEHDYNAYQRNVDLTGNPEVLCWRKFESGVVMNHIMQYFFKSSNGGYIGGLTKSMVEDYLCTDGLPITLSPLFQGDAQIEHVFKNRDPRLRQTVLHPDDQAYYSYGNSLSYTYPRLTGMSGGLMSATGYHIIKMYENIAAYADYNVSTVPIITLRLGEALLNYAEAKAELGTINQADLDMSINKLRDRVGMPHMNLNNIPVDLSYVGDGVSPLIVEIRRERRIELCLEGFRYDDLRRWKQGKKLEIKSLGILWDDVAKTRYPTSKVKSYVDPVSGKTYVDPYAGTDYENPVFDESKHYLWPIPLGVIAQNPNVGQNPGWK